MRTISYGHGQLPFTYTLVDNTHEHADRKHITVAHRLTVTDSAADIPREEFATQLTRLE